MPELPRTRNAIVSAASSNWPIDALGSGSDYTAFLDFAGVASLNFAYGGDEESNGVYHSAYDDFYWFTHFDDLDLCL